MKIGLIGIGFMGRCHLDQYIRLAREGSDIQLTAIADVDLKKFQGEFVQGNLQNLGMQKYDFSPYHCYSDAEEMMRLESLDAVDIALPTDLHAKYAVLAMKRGLHVLCEKPMALTTEACDSMIRASRASDKILMIAQCLRFWRTYEILKEYVNNGKLGKPVFFSFFRGGGMPKWTYENWGLQEKRSGGCLMDQHIHDTDILNWLFGVPKAVSSVGRNVLEGAGYDAISTRYRYDGFIAEASDDWAMNGQNMPFIMRYRANFEHGTLVFENGVTTLYSLNAPPVMLDDNQGDNAYYREIVYFGNALIKDRNKAEADLWGIRETVRMVCAEHQSADLNGVWVALGAGTEEII